MISDTTLSTSQTHSIGPHYMLSIMRIHFILCPLNYPPPIPARRTAYEHRKRMGFVFSNLATWWIGQLFRVINPTMTTKHILYTFFKTILTLRVNRWLPCIWFYINFINRLDKHYVPVGMNLICISLMSSSAFLPHNNRSHIYSAHNAVRQNTLVNSINQLIGRN